MARRGWSLLLSLAILTGCHSVPPHVPLGAWSSDRELTLASYARDPSLRRAYSAVRSDPTLFGHNVQVFAAHGAVAWFEGQCGELWPYDYDVIESSSGLLVYRDGETGDERKIAWDEQFMYLPLAGGRAQEVFRKISLDQAFLQHPCLKAAVEAE